MVLKFQLAFPLKHIIYSHVQINYRQITECKRILPSVNYVKEIPTFHHSFFLKGNPISSRCVLQNMWWLVSTLHLWHLSLSHQQYCVNSHDTHEHLNTWLCVWLYINYTELEAKGESDRLTEEQLKGLVNKKELLSITQKHCPNQAFAFWILEAELEKTELEIGQDIRLKTKGDGPFICECYLGNSLQ